MVGGGNRLRTSRVQMVQLRALVVPLTLLLHMEQ